MLIYFFIAILISVFTSANFFIRNAFFATAVSTDLTALFSSVPYISIIAIPAICYKTPLKEYEDFIPKSNLKKTFLKFLFLLSVYTATILLLIFPCLFVSLTGSVDAGQIFTSELCLIFYGATVISLCLFINQIFSNSILSFVISALILALSNSAHSVLLYLNPNPFVSYLLKNLSFAWHFDAASKGILDTRDILFFVLITFIFIYFSDFIYNFKKGKIYSGKEKYTKIITGIICVLLFMNSNNLYKRFDLSKSKNYSVSKYTNHLLEKIDDSLKITYYRSSNLTKYYPQIRDVSDFLNLYANQSKKISFSIKNPDKDIQIQNLLNNYGITSQQLRAVKNTSTEYINVFSAITLEYNGNTELIPFVMDSQTLEFDLDGRINHLISEKNRIVNIIIANGMNLQTDYSYVTPWLNSQGFICNEINLYNSDIEYELENTTGPLLIIGDINIYEKEITAIENYIISEKGNAFIAASPYSCDIEGEWTITENPESMLLNLLSYWGIEFLPDFCADLQCSRIQLYSQDDSSLFPENTVHTETVNYPLWIKIPGQTNFVSGMTLFWATPLELTSDENKKVEPYLFTGSSSYKVSIDKDADKLIETNPFIVRDNGIPKGTEYKNQIIAAEISGKLQGFYNYGSSSNSRIIVISDQYFVNSLMTGYNSTDYADYRNFDFLTNCLLRLNNENGLADLQNKKTFDNTLNKLTDVHQYFLIQTITYSTVFILIPLLLIIVLIILNIKNKYKYKQFFKEQDITKRADNK